jgi:hypothetical protein
MGGSQHIAEAAGRSLMGRHNPRHYCSLFKVGVAQRRPWALLMSLAMDPLDPDAGPGLPTRFRAGHATAVGSTSGRTGLANGGYGRRQLVAAMLEEKTGLIRIVARLEGH